MSNPNMVKVDFEWFERKAQGGPGTWENEFVLFDTCSSDELNQSIKKYIKDKEEKSCGYVQFMKATDIECILQRACAPKKDENCREKLTSKDFNDEACYVCKSIFGDFSESEIKRESKSIQMAWKVGQQLRNKEKEQ